MPLIGRFLHYDGTMIKTRSTVYSSVIAALLIAVSVSLAAAQELKLSDEVQPMPPAITVPSLDTLAPLKGGQPQPNSTAKAKPQNPTVEMAGPLPEIRAKEQEELFTSLRKASSPEKSHAIASRLRQSFARTGSDSLDVMLRWAETALNQSRDSEAQDFIDEVMAQRSDLASVWLLRSRLHLRRNELAPALSDMRQAMILEPRNFDVLINYATLLRETGNTKGALRLYEQALNVYPMMKEAQDELLKLTEANSDIAL